MHGCVRCGRDVPTTNLWHVIIFVFTITMRCKYHDNVIRTVMAYEVHDQ